LELVRLAEPTRLVGLMTLTLAAASTSALFSYTFIDSARVSVLYWTLGAALGILLHIVIYPASIEHIFRPAAAESPSPVNARRERSIGIPLPFDHRKASCEPIHQAAEGRNAVL
jgi:hypothetical protein